MSINFAKLPPDIREEAELSQRRTLHRFNLLLRAHRPMETKNAADENVTPSLSIYEDEEDEGKDNDKNKSEDKDADEDNHVEKEEDRMKHFIDLTDNEGYVINRQI